MLATTGPTNVRPSHHTGVACGEASRCITYVRPTELHRMVGRPAMGPVGKSARIPVSRSQMRRSVGAHTIAPCVPPPLCRRTIPSPLWGAGSHNGPQPSEADLQEARPGSRAVGRVGGGAWGVGVCWREVGPGGHMPAGTPARGGGIAANPQKTGTPGASPLPGAQRSRHTQWGRMKEGGGGRRGYEERRRMGHWYG